MILCTRYVLNAMLGTEMLQKWLGENDSMFIIKFININAITHKADGMI